MSAFSVFYSGTSTRVKSKARAFAINVVVGLLQLATFVIIVGWIWSILWGMTFIQFAGMQRPLLNTEHAMGIKKAAAPSIDWPRTLPLCSTLD